MSLGSVTRAAIMGLAVIPLVASQNVTNNTSTGVSIEDLFQQQQHLNVAMDRLWVMLTAVAILSMQGGFTLLEIGAVQVKNVRSILMKNSLDTMFGVMGWYILGFGLYYGAGSFAGADPNLYFLTDPQYFASFVQQFGFANTAATIVSGGVCSRIRFQSYTIFAFIFQAVVYPIVAHWAWISGGFLYERGFVDFAGSGVVHALGGIAGLTGAIMVGPRIGRYYEPEPGEKHFQVRTLPQHSAPFMVLGGMCLFFAWFAFNAGSSGGLSDADSLASAERAMVNTLLGGTAGAAVATMFMLLTHKTQDLGTLINALLAGLVAITGPCASVETWAAVLIGGSAGLLYIPCAYLLLHRIGVDDPLNVFVIHGLAGIYGLLMTGIFDVNSGLFYGGGMGLLGVQLLGAGVITAVSVVSTFLIFGITYKLVGIRVSADGQLMGLDLLYHNTNAYPEFDSIAIREFALKKSQLEKIQGQNRNRGKTSQNHTSQKNTETKKPSTLINGSLNDDNQSYV